MNPFKKKTKSETAAAKIEEEEIKVEKAEIKEKENQEENLDGLFDEPMDVEEGIYERWKEKVEGDFVVAFSRGQRRDGKAETGSQTTGTAAKTGGENRSEAGIR